MTDVRCRSKEKPDSQDIHEKLESLVDNGENMKIKNRIRTIIFLALIILFSSEVPGVFGAPGDPDLSFGIGGSATYQTFPLVSSILADENLYYTCCHLTQQADGKTIVAGATDSDKMLRIIRFNADGTVDTTYGLSGQAVESAFPSIVVYGVPLAIKIDRYGKLLVAGYINGGSVLTHFALWRFNTNGLLDQTFGTNGHIYWTDAVNSQAIAITNYLDTIFVLRWADNPGLSDKTVHALNNNGTFIPTFGGAGFGRIIVDRAEDIAIQPVSNKLLVATMNEVRRYSIQGILDTTFGTQGIATLCANASPGGIFLNRLAVQSNGKIVAARTLYVAYVSLNFYSMTRLTDRGRLDSTFDLDGCKGLESYWDMTPDNFGIAKRVRIQSDGRIVTSNNRRYNVDGSIDSFYQPVNRNQTQDVWVQPNDGRIVSLQASNNSAWQFDTREDYVIYRFLP